MVEKKEGKKGGKKKIREEVRVKNKEGKKGAKQKRG